MKMTNQEIYTNAINYTEAFKEFSEYIPAKINFIIQKNVQKLTELAKDIDVARADVAKHYGTPAEDGNSYEIKDENKEIAMKELYDLFTIEQEIEIKKVNIDDFGDIKFTPQQMSALMFMLEE